MSIRITDQPIVVPIYSSQEAIDGAVVDFLGVVRGTEIGEAITGIEYETFFEMAQHQLELLGKKYITQFGISGLDCIHRVGFVPIGEASLFVRVVAPHRKEAFDAMTGFIEELKQVVPIWKHPRIESANSL